MTISADNSFDEEYIPTLGKYARYPGGLTVDFSDIKWITPAGIVGAFLITQYRSESGLWTLVSPPEETDVLNYLGRIDFFRHLPKRAVLKQDVSHLQRHQRNESHDFTTILPLDGENIREICDVVISFLQDQMPSRWRQVYSPFEEMLSNIENHASHGLRHSVFSCAHVQRYSNRMELAVGDLGVGFLKTMQDNPDNSDLSSEEDAIRGAFEEGRSRLNKTNDYRGGGLQRVSRITKNLEGQLTLRTGDGLLEQYSGGRRQYRSLSGSLPGTIGWIRLPVE